MAHLGRFVEQALMPPSLHHAGVVLVPSRATFEDVSHYYPFAKDKIRITPLAPAIAPLPEQDLRDEPPYALFVGTIEPRKNLARVIEAFSMVVQETGCPHQLLIAGNSGWKNKTIMKQMQVAEAGGKIRYLGRVSDSHLAQLYGGSQFLLAPSLYEGFGLQIVEAMSFGKPVITSNVSSMPEVAGEGAILVDPCSVAEIAGAIRLLVQDEATRADLGARAARHARNFTWEQTATQTLLAIEEAVALRMQC